MIAADTGDEGQMMFADEDPPPHEPPTLPPWRVLIVDDDEQVHKITRLALRNLCYCGRALHMVSATSGADARNLLDQPDHGFAVALIDVVMESTLSGLELVHHVRHVLSNRAIRLILRTGQPGNAPEAEVIIKYEIDDYKEKTELTVQKLITAVVASLRTYAYVEEIANLNATLEARVAMRTAELEKLAMLDPLTGAANRRHLDQRAMVEIEHCRREGTALGIAVFDIDHFKRVNDTHGHATGDHVLCQVVNTAKNTLRASDFLARVGGEEFVVLLPKQEATAATVAAERMRAAIAAAPITLPSGATLEVTASFGVTCLDGAGLESALARADQALYTAKEGGRNRVVQA